MSLFPAPPWLPNSIRRCSRRSTITRVVSLTWLTQSSYPATDAEVTVQCGTCCVARMHACGQPKASRSPLLCLRMLPDQMSHSAWLNVTAQNTHPENVSWREAAVIHPASIARAKNHKPGELGKLSLSRSSDRNHHNQALIGDPMPKPALDRRRQFARLSPPGHQLHGMRLDQGWGSISRQTNQKTA